MYKFAPLSYHILQSVKGQFNCFRGFLSSRHTEKSLREGVKRVLLLNKQKYHLLDSNLNLR